jgi:hypothetical protein
MPDGLWVREIRVKVKQPGFRPDEIVLVTTLLDSELYTTEEIADLFLKRWNIELDLRSIKIEMQMDVLRCQTPDMVEKEIWMHTLGWIAPCVQRNHISIQETRAQRVTRLACEVQRPAPCRRLRGTSFGITRLGVRDRACHRRVGPPAELGQSSPTALFREFDIGIELGNILRLAAFGVEVVNGDVLRQDGFRELDHGQCLRGVEDAQERSRGGAVLLKISERPDGFKHLRRVG